MTERRLRILHVTRNLPPLVGGMERLNWHIADELSQRADVHVIGPQGGASLKPEGVTVTEAPLRPLWRFLLASARQAVAIARRFRPDIVLAGSGLSALAALLAARACKARAAVYVHGLDLVAKHPVYRSLWLPAIRRMDVVIANSRPTADLALALGVRRERLHLVHPGVQMPDAAQSADTLQAFRQRHGLGDARLLLSIGRLTTRKGLREFVQHALPTIVRQNANVLLIVIGDTPTDSLQADLQTRQSIESTAEAAGVGQHVRFLGLVDDSTLACAYENATAHIFPVRSLPGDPEGFGMVAIEAAAHGLPTVAFASGGVIDAVSEGQSGHLIPQKDYDAFARSVLQILTDGKDIWSTRATSFAANFAWSAFGHRLIDALTTGQESTDAKTSPAASQEDAPERRAHAITDLRSRRLKAMKIERLLDLDSLSGPIRILEIGTGSGGIAHYFATHSTLECVVTAIDVRDNRQVHEGYEYLPVQGVTLPFNDARFDVIISNHVIEHVGDTGAQLEHLREIRRVLKPCGIGYLAVPNRWMLTEPHYRLKFLSWWPQRWRTRYLRLWRKGEFYDCEPLEMHQLERMLAESGLSGRNLCVEGWRATFNIERPDTFATRLLAWVPDTLLRLLNPINPTLIYRIGRTDRQTVTDH